MSDLAQPVVTTLLCLAPAARAAARATCSDCRGQDVEVQGWRRRRQGCVRCAPRARVMSWRQRSLCDVAPPRQLTAATFATRGRPLPHATHPCSITSEFLAQFNKEKQAIEGTIDAVMCVERCRRVCVWGGCGGGRADGGRGAAPLTSATANQPNVHARPCPRRMATRQITSLMQESQTAFSPEELDSAWCVRAACRPSLRVSRLWVARAPARRRP